MKQVMLMVFLLLTVPVGAQENLTIHGTAGSQYRHSWRMKIIKITVTPQMAFWLEDEQGRYKATIYVTQKAATGRWEGGRSIRRPDALPVWSHRRGVPAPDGLYMPDRDHPLAESLTGATPRDSFVHQWRIPGVLLPGTYRVFAEINNSFDFNDTFAEGLSESSKYYNDKNGQPSLVWQGTITLAGEPASVTLTPAGAGHPAGRDGDLHDDLLPLLTTAREIFSDITIEYAPAR